MFENFYKKNNTESADLMKKNILAAKINQVATNIRNLLYLDEERFENNSKIREEIEAFNNNLEEIEAEIREVSTNSEQDREILESKLSDLDKLYQKIKDLIAEN